MSNKTTPAGSFQFKTKEKSFKFRVDGSDPRNSPIYTYSDGAVYWTYPSSRESYLKLISEDKARENIEIGYWIVLPSTPETRADLPFYSKLQSFVEDNRFAVKVFGKGFEFIDEKGEYPVYRAETEEECVSIMDSLNVLKGSL